MNLHVPFHFRVYPSSSLPKLHQVLCQMLYQTALQNNKRACIAGLYALELVIKQMGRTSFHSNDINIFTTLYLSKEDLEKIETKFSQVFNDHICFTDKLFESRSRVNRMRQIWNLKIAKIWYLDNIQEIEPPLQIIVQ